MKLPKKDINGQGNPEDHKEKWIAIFGIAAILLGGFAFFFKFIIPCPPGEGKFSLILCKPYKTFTEVPVDRFTRNIKYSGSTALQTSTTPIKENISKSHENFTLEFKPLDASKKSPNKVIAWSGEGIQELIDNKIDIAFSSRGLTENELKKASLNKVNIEAIPVAKSGLAIFVAKDEGIIESLTLDNLRSIYTVPDLTLKSIEIESKYSGEPIKPFSPDPVDNQGEPEYFQKEILNNQSFSSTVQEPANSSITGKNGLIDEVAKQVGRIGFADASIVCSDSRVKSLKIVKDGGSFPACLQSEGQSEPNIAAIANDTYPLTRELFVVIKRDGEESEKAGEAYVDMLLSDEGQRILKKAKYIPIRVLR